MVEVLAKCKSPCNKYDENDHPHDDPDQCQDTIDSEIQFQLVHGFHEAVLISIKIGLFRCGTCLVKDHTHPDG